MSFLGSRSILTALLGALLCTVRVAHADQDSPDKGDGSSDKDKSDGSSADKDKDKEKESSGSKKSNLVGRVSSEVSFYSDSEAVTVVTPTIGASIENPLSEWSVGAHYLVDQGVVLVGIDSLNIDNTGAEAHGARPAHTVLLGAGIHVVEHLRGLHDIPPSGAFFTAVPPKIEGFGTFPVRAFARIPTASV